MTYDTYTHITQGASQCCSCITIIDTIILTIYTNDAHLSDTTGGFAVLFRGLTMRLATVIPASAIMVTVYEAIKTIDI
jgi:hypothetical protein